MDFNKSSYFAGIGTVCAAITLGFAAGAMITGGPAVQTPNRLERVAASTALAKSPERPVVVANATPPEPATMAAPIPTPAPSPQPVAQQPAPQLTNIQPPHTTPAILAKGEDAPTLAATSRDTSNDRAAELKRAADRKRADERKFSERRKRQEIEDAANAVRQMKRDGVIDQVVQREEAPREMPRLGFFGIANE